jgi:hypothetical protein
MRLSLPMLIIALALSGCAGGTVFYAEGIDIATREADLAACERQALTEFPIRLETRFTPRVFVPARQICNSAGSCVIRPGYFEGGERYTVDVNKPFRATALRGCMGARGYARVGLPACEPGTQVRLSTVMPPLTGGTCLYSTGPGPALIVNPI